VRLTPRALAERPAADSALIARIVKAAFGQRRKTLSNALAGVVTPDQITAAGIEPRVRAEQLAPAAFVALARVVGHAEMQNRKPVAGNR
jgi:16S rRNA (adenine1518-N6/adenine1519-N6)-dimethyltransferase